MPTESSQQAHRRLQASRQAQVSASNQTLNRFLGNRQPSWMSGEGRQTAQSPNEASTQALRNLAHFSPPTTQGENHVAPEFSITGSTYDLLDIASQPRRQQQAGVVQLPIASHEPPHQQTQLPEGLEVDSSLHQFDRSNL
jgi:hypothetical protein